MMRTLAIVLAALILSGCAAPADQEIEVTRIVEVTRVVEADCPTCPDCQACPEVQRCPTQAAAAPAAGEGQAPKGQGSYLVGVEMAPGIWRSTGTGDSCWLSIKDFAGETEDLTGDPPGGTFRIPPGDFVVVLEDIGSVCTWEFLKP